MQHYERGGQNPRSKYLESVLRYVAYWSPLGLLWDRSVWRCEGYHGTCDLSYTRRVLSYTELPLFDKAFRCRSGCAAEIFLITRQKQVKCCSFPGSLRPCLPFLCPE